MKNSIIFFGFIFLTFSLSAQDWTSLIASSDNYYELTERADAFFEQKGKGKGSGYKQFMRWRGEMEYKMDNDGTIPNFSALNLRAYQSQQRKLSYASGRMTHGEWEDLGPFDYYTSDSYSSGGVGRINCMAFHPTDPDILYVGTPVGGMWKSTDAGMTWSPMTDAFASIGISGIVVHPTNPDTIFILTGDGDGSQSRSTGVLKTTDGGLTWENTDLVFGTTDNKHGQKLIGHPSNGDILFAAIRDNVGSGPAGGIYRTIDGGENWIQVETMVAAWDIEFQPSDSLIMFATGRKSGGNPTFFKSTDGGASWFEDGDPDFPTSGVARMMIANSPSQPTNVYLLAGGDTGMSGTFQGLFKSTDDGAGFDLMSTTPNILGWAMSGNDNSDQAGYDLALIVDPEDDSKVFVAGINMWKSEDNGLTWARETWQRRDDPLNPYVHADWHNLYFHNGSLYSNNDGGIYRSEDFGNSWTELTAGMSIMQFYELDILNNEYLGGTQDNGTNGQKFTDSQVHNLWGGDGFGAVWHTGDNSIQYISSQNAIYRRQFGSSIPVSPIELGNNDFWFNEIEMHTTNPDFVFVSTFDEVYRGNGDAFGFSWDSLFTSSMSANDRVNGFVQGVNNEEVMYVVIGDTLIRTDDLGSNPPTWTDLPVPFTPNMADVEVHPDDADQVWVCATGYTAGRKVYFSDDGGMSWTNISMGLPNVPMRCLVHEGSPENGIYVGTEIGVYYRNDNMSEWIYFSNLLPNTVIADLEISGGEIFAGTFGRGVWRSDLYSSCPVNLTLTQANDLSNPFSIGTQLYHASNSITSSRIMGNGLGTYVEYNAGNYVKMPVGFNAKLGSQVLARIGGCPD